MKPMWEKEDEERKRKFKTKCASVDRNMKEVLVELLDEYLKETCKTE